MATFVPEALQDSDIYPHTRDPVFDRGTRNGSARLTDPTRNRWPGAPEDSRVCSRSVWPVPLDSRAQYAEQGSVDNGHHGVHEERDEEEIGSRI